MNDIVATRAFSAADQEWFAQASSDRNPMHMDPVAARRTQASAPVVHGIHALIWSLDELARAGQPLAKLTSVKVEFAKFIYLDRPISLRITRSSASMTRVELTDDGLPVTSLTLRFGTRAEAPEAGFWDGAADVVVGTAPHEPPFAAMGAGTGWLSPPPAGAELATRYADLAREIGAARIAALAQTSTLVGMVCPGLHSIYSSLALTLVEGLPQRPGIAYRTADADQRFNMLTMEVAGSGLTGEVVAFARQAPLGPPALEGLRGRLTGGEFAGVSAFIVGGSRGLGAVSASLIAAGGGRVTVTYFHGRDEAEALCKRLNDECGGTIAKALKFDARGDLAAQLAGLDTDINQFYYFATPQIFRQQAVLFSDKAYRDFHEIYVDRFYAMCMFLSEHVQQKELSIFYPSSEAVTERPKGMTEYAMSKAAGELLCADLDKFLPNLKVQWYRIPRTATDQTATVAVVPAEDPIDVMLPLIRSLTAGATA